MNILGPIALFFGFQLAGEIAAKGLGLPVPGPVLGMALMFCLLLLRPAVFGFVAPTARVILANLSLLFVPAGVGVVANLDVLARDGLALAVILVVSTIFAMLVSVGSFLAVQRLMRGQK